MGSQRVAFIGAGARSTVYARAYLNEPGIEIAGVADPSPVSRRVMWQRVGLPAEVPEFDDWRTMLAALPDLDGVVISSPNHTHADPAVACFERGLPIALEKPLAADPADCERILAAERANDGRSLLGFVLRSAPFHQTIHRLIVTEQRLGPLLSVQADELVGWGVSSVMNRSPWRRYQAQSGGSMLEKSCHDLDLLNWICASRPRALASFGSRRIFTPNPALPDRCEGCVAATACRYYREPPLASQEDQAEAAFHQFLREDADRCIYNLDGDTADVQSVTIEYESGVVATFVLNFHCAGPRAGRNFHAVGLRGRVWGSMHEHKVYWYDNASDQTTEYDTRGDGSGHGGGDRYHALLLGRMMSEPDYRPDQNAAAGYLSAMACFATDRSRWEQRTVQFDYRGDGRIRLI